MGGVSHLATRPGCCDTSGVAQFRVGELWRYPVKSMMGERVEQLQVAVRGAVGDRAWATRDEVSAARKRSVRS
jgi:uncharacterized protein YcbX